MIYDETVERSLLGLMLVQPGQIADIAPLVGAEDFYRPLHQTVYVVLVDAWRAGAPLDAVTLAATGGKDIDAAMVGALVADAGFSHERLVSTLVGMRVRRDLIVAGSEVVQLAQDMSADPFEARDAASAKIRSVDAPTEQVRDLWTLDGFVEQPDSSEPWVIPGLFRQGWRAIVVATEGAGKSVLSRQLAIASAAGVHPLCFEPMPAIRSLIVDLENPVSAIKQTARKIRHQAQRHGNWNPDNVRVWHRPSGIDVRRRSDRAALEGAIALVRPQFVALGPLYKAYTPKARESDELAAGEVQEVFDDLRTRYGFALLLEHHAPKPQGGFRDMLPYGSSLWLRWPEMGLKLTPADMPNTLDVGRWRADRLDNAWPQRLARGKNWPWEGEWNGNWQEAIRSVTEPSEA